MGNDREGPLGGPLVLLEHLDFVITADPSGTVIEDACVLVDGERIADVGPAEEVLSRLPSGRSVRRRSGRRRGLIPGLIDTHVHLSEMLARAVFPDVLGTRPWVFHWAKPFYASIGPEDEKVGVLLGMAEMLRSGTTCFLDMGAQNDAGVTARAALEIGLRGVVSRHAADRPPEELPPGWSEEMLAHHFFPSADAALEALEDAVRRWNGAGGGRIRCWVNIEGKEPCSLELHVGARELASRLGVGTTYHIASSIEEARASERRDGLWPVTRVARAGGLGPNLVLAHAVALTDEEVEAIAEAGTSVAFCPSSSLKLAKGATAIGKYPELMAAGAAVCLGTDGVAAAGNVNLHRQVHLAAGLFKDARMDPFLGGAAVALRMATRDAAKALGLLDEIGSIEVGKQADFVLFDLDHHEWVPYADPLQALVWSASPASIVETWVAGRVLFENNAIAGLDEASLREEARARAAEVVARAGLGPGVPTTTSLYD